MKQQWRVAFYTQSRWDLAFINFDCARTQLVGRGKFDSAPRTFDSILRVGPFGWRIYREVVA